jgi:hypothetical protein
MFKGVTRPQILAAPGVCREGVRTCLLAARHWPLVAALGWLAWGCREAPTPTGPKPGGPNESAPAVTTIPGRDTTVDSVGVLRIEVIAHDQARIDTVSLRISGAAIAFPPDTVNDTVFDALYTIPLGSLRHKPFSFRVAAGDVLGHDTVTDSVTVRLR